MKFRKKPVVIEAAQWFPDKPVEDVIFPVGSDGRDIDFHDLHGPDRGLIETLEGPHIVTPGDWIITGVAGEKYPCKPAIFEATYELA